MALFRFAFGNLNSCYRTGVRGLHRKYGPWRRFSALYTELVLDRSRLISDFLDFV